jgi:hypothetical protein
LHLGQPGLAQGHGDREEEHGYRAMLSAIVSTHRSVPVCSWTQSNREFVSSGAMLVDLGLIADGKVAAGYPHEANVRR